MNEGEQEHLERLKQELYGRKETPTPLHRSRLPGLVDPGQGDWLRVEPAHITNRFLAFTLLKKILWWSLGFFGLMALLALFVFYRGKNLVSSGNIDVVVTGPAEIAAGQELSFQTAVTNKNKVALELVDLIVEYPAGTRVAGAVNQALARERFPLGKIAPGAIASQLIRAVLFGEKGSRADIKLTVEYRLADSSAIFGRESSYNVDIGSTPLVLLLDLPLEVNNNQEIVINTQIQSNAANVITDPVVLVGYPAGFRFSGAAPAPSRGQNIWRLNSLKPGEKITIQIRGTLEGQDEEQKSFHVAAGTMDQESADELSATYGSTFSTLTIRRPFVGLDASINSMGTSEYVTDSREPIRIDINWVNNLPGEVTEGEILATLSGRALDQSSVSAGQGFYNSSANTVLWTKLNKTDLASIAPSGTGRASFSFTSLPLVSDEGASLRQPTLTLDIKFKGKRINEGGETENIFSTVSKKIKFNSVAQLAGKVLARTGPFTNHGPIPPRVDQETTYTVNWAVLNSSNNLGGAQVTASLPSYVKWLGTVQPGAETVTFRPSDSGGGQVVWELGQVSPGIGTQTAAREVSFQVALMPSLSQVGEAPALITDSTFSALDTFTKQILTVKLKRTLDTAFVSEPGFQLGDDRVVK